MTRTSSQPRRRDVTAFDKRATGYETGRRGRWHRDIVNRTVDLALSSRPAPGRVLDVGCGSGYLLRQLAARVPGASELVGIDPAPTMIRTAQAMAGDARLRYRAGVAEQLPYPDGSFDLVVSTVSFHHWVGQQAGLVECARVLTPGGQLVLTDLFSWFFVPTLVIGRRGKAPTKRRATQLLAASGLHDLRWHRLYSMILQTVTATK